MVSRVLYGTQLRLALWASQPQPFFSNGTVNAHCYMYYIHVQWTVRSTHSGKQGKRMNSNSIWLHACTLTIFSEAKMTESETVTSTVSLVHGWPTYIVNVNVLHLLVQWVGVQFTSVPCTHSRNLLQFSLGSTYFHLHRLTFLTLTFLKQCWEGADMVVYMRATGRKMEGKGLQLRWYHQVVVKCHRKLRFGVLLLVIQTSSHILELPLIGSTRSLSQSWP